MRCQRRFPQVGTRVASLTDSRLLQQFRAAETGSSWRATMVAADRDRHARAAGSPARAFRAAPAAALPATREAAAPREALGSTERFPSAVQEAKIGPNKDISQVTAPIVVKCITSLKLMGLL